MSSDDSSSKHRRLWRIAYYAIPIASTLYAFGLYIYVCLRYPHYLNFTDWLRLGAFSICALLLTCKLVPPLCRWASRIARLTKYSKAIYYLLTMVPGLWCLSFFAAIIGLTPGDWASSIAFSTKMTINVSCLGGLYLFISEKAWPSRGKKKE